eukprot:1156551-Pelagomonas_calceolata.AAC.8
MLVRRALQLPRSTGLILRHPGFRLHNSVRTSAAADMDKSVELAMFQKEHCARPCLALAHSLQYNFGPYKIRGDEVFYISKLSFAFVNLKPVVPGGSSFPPPEGTREGYPDQERGWRTYDPAGRLSAQQIKLQRETFTEGFSQTVQLISL